MKKSFLISALICTILFACSPQNKKSIAVSSQLPESPITATRTQTTVTPTSTSKPTITPAPSYPTKQVLLDYTMGGFHTLFEMYYTDYGMDGLSEIVLYTDGQLIIPGNPYQQKILSKDEIDQLLAELEMLGFYTIESNQQHDPSDKIYSFGDQYEGVSDPIWHCILINKGQTRKLCAWKPYEKFLVPEMKSIMKFLDGYQPEGMTSYSPDRVLLWVRAGRSPYIEDLPEKAVLWNESLPTLETRDEKLVYADGENAKQIFALFDNEVSTIVISQNNIEYTVSIDIVLPHEQLQLQP